MNTNGSAFFEDSLYYSCIFISYFKRGVVVYYHIDMGEFV